jgi:carbonic anhydrase
VQYPAEIQLFHWNTKYSYNEAISAPDGLVAISFLYEVAETDNPALDTWLSGAQRLESSCSRSQSNTCREPLAGLNMSELLPPGGIQLSDNYFYYNGSITLPSCRENVLWINYEKTIPISETQLNILRELLISLNEFSEQNSECVNNFRPLLDLNPTTISRKYIHRKHPAIE